MKVKVLNEARPLESGYHYTNIVGMINILNSGTMKATNRRLGLDDSRLSTKTLNTPVKDLLKPLLTDEEREKIERLYRDSGARQKQLSYYMTKESEARIKSKIKNLDMTLKDAFKANLIDKTLMTCLDMTELKFKGDFNDAFRNAAIAGHEMGYGDSKTGRRTGVAFFNNKSWSYTRSKVPINVLDRKPDLVRITLDIDKISRKQSMEPFTWAGNSRSTKNYEYEERIVGDTENIGEYIKSIDFPEEIYDDKHELLLWHGKPVPVSTISDSLQDFFENEGEYQENIYILNHLHAGSKDLERVTVKDYYRNYINDSLSKNRVKSISGKSVRTSKKLNLKNIEDVVQFIKSAESVTSVKEPGKTRKKTVKKKLNIKIGTYKTPGLMKRYIVTKKIWDKLDYALDIMRGKKNLPKDTPDKKSKSILPTWIAEKLKKLPRHDGKVYVIQQKDSNFSSFLLTKNPDAAILKSSALSKALKLEVNDEIEIIDKSSKMKNCHPLRKRKSYFTNTRYLKLLKSWASKSKDKRAFFDSLEDFVAFVYDFMDKRLETKLEGLMLVTDHGGLQISIDTDKQSATFAHQQSCI